MTNFKILIQYDGTRYQGWQRLGNSDNTIQGKIENVLKKMCGHNVEIHGAGRTDAGVHALEQVASFKINTDKSEQYIKKYLNHYLPDDIGIIDCIIMHERFHARLNAKGKHYSYRLWDGENKNIFERKYIVSIDKRLDENAMRKACKIMCGTHDFRAFSSVNKRFKKSTVRTVDKIEITRQQEEIFIDFYGNGFLYNMVRILTGTLVEIGSNQRDIESINKAFETLDRQNAGITMPPHGLILKKVYY